MLNREERKSIKSLMQREIIPAIGCTEPIAVSLCVAKSVEILGVLPEKIDVYLSANILKNAMGVGIPGTGMIGLPIAVALGALIGKSAYGLEVLRDLTHRDVERGKKYIAEQRVGISLKENITEILYIEVHCFSGTEQSVAVISGVHTQFTYLEKNGEVLLEKSCGAASDDESDDFSLTFHHVYEYALESPLDELRFMLEAAQMNRNAFEASQKQHYGHSVAQSLMGDRGKLLFGDNIHSRMIAATAGACDARMDGALIPVMSNSGSGNQGVAATLPVLTYAESIHCSEEQLIRERTDGDLYQAVVGAPFRIVRVCGCLHRIGLCHHLPDGRQLRTDYLHGEKHDRQYYRNDLRRRQAQLCFEDCERGIYCYLVCSDGHREQGGLFSRGHCG